MDDVGGKAGDEEEEKEGGGHGGQEWFHGWSFVAGSKLKGESSQAELVC